MIVYRVFIVESCLNNVDQGSMKGQNAIQFRIEDVFARLTKLEFYK